MRFRKAGAVGVGLLMLSQAAFARRRAEASFAVEVAATVGWALAHACCDSHRNRRPDPARCR